MKRPTGITVVTTLFGISGLLNLLAGAAMLLMGTTIPGMKPIMAATVVGGVIVLFGLLDLVVAYGTWEMYKWARTAGIVLGVLSLLSFPIGTIIGLVILYYLTLHDETVAVFKVQDLKNENEIFEFE
jgi:hypothetical protein